MQTYLRCDEDDLQESWDGCYIGQRLCHLERGGSGRIHTILVLIFSS